MKLLTNDEKGIVVKLENGMILLMDDNGFTAKNMPGRGKDVATTEWSDWQLLNETLKKITRGKPIHRRS